MKPQTVFAVLRIVLCLCVVGIIMTFVLSPLASDEPLGLAYPYWAILTGIYFLTALALTGMACLLTSPQYGMNYFGLRISIRQLTAIFFSSTAGWMITSYLVPFSKTDPHLASFPFQFFFLIFSVAFFASTLLVLIGAYHLIRHG